MLGARNRRPAAPIPPPMITCPVRTRLWILALAGLELDDRTMRVAFALLDCARFDG